MALRTRKLSGAFEKRAPGHSWELWQSVFIELNLHLPNCSIPQKLVWLTLFKFPFVLPYTTQNSGRFCPHFTLFFIYWYRDATRTLLFIRIINCCCHKISNKLKCRTYLTTLRTLHLTWNKDCVLHSLIQFSIHEETNGTQIQRTCESSFIEVVYRTDLERGNCH